MRQETATIPYAYSSMILFKDLSEPKSKCLKSHADNARVKTPNNFISNVFIVLPSADSPHRSIKARQNKIPVNVFFITVCFLRLNHFTFIDQPVKVGNIDEDLPTRAARLVVAELTVEVLLLDPLNTHVGILGGLLAVEPSFLNLNNLSLYVDSPSHDILTIVITFNS